MKRRSYNTHFKTTQIKSGERRVLVTVRKSLDWYRPEVLLHDKTVPDVSVYANKKAYIGL